MSLDWLPDLLLLEDSDGNWLLFLERLHQCFLADFVDNKPTWPGKRVALKRHPEYEGKSATFWHLISEGEIETERVPEFRRCERIAWPRPMIVEFDDASPGTSKCRLRWWKSVRRGECRFVLAVDDFSYIVVVADRGEYVLLWTAYYVKHEHQRNKLRRDWSTYWKGPKG